MGALERHEVAGIDERARGFNRVAELHAQEQGVLARLRYEQAVVAGEPGATAQDAMARLVAALHARGFTQLRSRLSFTGERYLGSQEPWIEYPDPPPPGVVGRLRALLRRLLPTPDGREP